ncbi:MAG: NAD(+)/NADH kinase [Lachnospiraceae bacterium]|nr:NAD(+)/NADH kinase [Lachnospiraceae bacterium]
MKNYLVVYNRDKDVGGTVTGSIAGYLSERGCKCSSLAVSHDAIPAAELNESAKDAECVLVLGGDGTLIQVAGALAGRDIPLLGINLGTLGYLAGVEKDNIMPTLDRLINDDYDVEERMMLSAVTGGNESTALNDIVISRLGDLRIVRYMIYVNNRCLSVYEADGIIVSTPTGSTGYNLSAGGPIVEPNASLILVTPICPHTLNTRAVVLSAEDEIRIEVLSSKYSHEYEASLSCDGATAIDLKAGDSVEIKRAEGVTKVIKMSREGFLDVLSRKFGVTT